MNQIAKSKFLEKVRYSFSPHKKKEVLQISDKQTLYP